MCELNVVRFMISIYQSFENEDVNILARSLVKVHRFLYCSIVLTNIFFLEFSCQMAFYERCLSCTTITDKNKLEI